MFKNNFPRCFGETNQELEKLNVEIQNNQLTIHDLNAFYDSLTNLSLKQIEHEVVIFDSAASTNTKEEIKMRFNLKRCPTKTFMAE